ncbi:hypothetical protein ALI44B_07470 [Leifsonia sp. ALI-44-B]|jgi:hypothetical protein|uniref:hypothetical protein n=1 Tax=Leifsonia sp. ALI-44-B TaxID=1933776 RepID=UPI00097C167F|nr:hypothetical protein [Leifsonia sp. ALI-44-B]ONI60461.1 hypothetical protein ALI44B_07470 [Leifsonia sp. ALI-44-B]
MTRRVLVPLLATAVACTLGLGLSACTTPRTVGPDPSVVWDTDEPTGPLESDPIVIRARAADLAQKLAQNSNDFSRGDLRSTWTGSAIGTMSSDRVNALKNPDNFEPRVAPGPTPWNAMAVDTDEDGNTVVKGCALADGWYISDGHPAPEKPADSRPTELTFVFDGSDADALVSRIVRSNVACTTTDVAVGRFDPQPRLEEASAPVIAP